jgi:hypothetical protein
MDHATTADASLAVLYRDRHTQAAHVAFVHRWSRGPPHLLDFAISSITTKERSQQTPRSHVAVTMMAARCLPTIGEVTCDRAPDQHPVVLAMEKVTSSFNVLTKDNVSFSITRPGYDRQQV